MKKNSFLSTLFISIVLLFLYIPIIVIVVYSFNSNMNRIPITFDGFSLHWYKSLFSGNHPYSNALGLSFVVAIFSVLLSGIIGTLGAVGITYKSLISKQKITRSDEIMENIVTLPIMIPEIILAIAFMGLFNAIGISGNIWRLVFAHTTFCIPYIFISVKSRLIGLDRALFDAARDLGASPLAIFRDITLPLVKPAIVSGMFLAFAMSMDDFVISYFVYGVGEGTLPMLIYSSVKVGVSLQINALCTMIIVIIFTMVALSQFFKAKKSKAIRESY